MENFSLTGSYVLGSHAWGFTVLLVKLWRIKLRQPVSVEGN